MFGLALKARFFFFKIPLIDTDFDGFIRMNCGKNIDITVVFLPSLPAPDVYVDTQPEADSPLANKH